MNGETSEYAPQGEPGPEPAKVKTCARCGMQYQGPIAAHRAAPVKRGGCIPLPPDDPSTLNEQVHGVEVIQAVREDARHPETDGA